MLATARRGSPILLFAAALTTLVLLISSSAAAPAQAAGGSACRVAATSSTAPTVRLAGDEDPFEIAKWFAGRVGGPGVEWGAVMAVGYLSKLTGLNKILPESSEAKVLKQLEGISVRLNDISTRLDRLSGNVDQLIGEAREANFGLAMAPLCSIANRQRGLFKQRYVPMVRAAAKLGEILAGKHPQEADEKDGNGFTPRSRVAVLKQEFLDEYDKKSNDLQAGIGDLHDALVPNSARTPVLNAYGKVLLGKRFLTRADSEALRDLYTGLAEVRILASWMAAEYWTSKPQNPEALKIIQDEYAAQNAEERRHLPPMIPRGVVLDLGRINASSTERVPMWFAPVDHDLGWLPANKLVAPLPPSISIDEVGAALKDVNAPGADGRKDLGKGWAAPTRAQFEALISNDCIADPTNPEKFKVGGCKNAVGPATGGTVAGYLLKLNSDDRTWQQLFCTNGPTRTCAPGVGPGPTGPHAFVWTDMPLPQTIKCGHLFLGRTWTRTYRTYTGFHTMADRPSHDFFPHLPGEAPLYQLQDEYPANYACDSYLFELAFGRKNAGVPRNSLVEGVLLAIRYTGAEDRSKAESVDYMAQKVSACSAAGPTLTGTRRDDVLRGTPGRDVMVGGRGDDVIRALGGNDLVCAGAGDDAVSGGAGNDTLNGGGGDDVLSGGAGNDALSGGGGENLLQGGPGQNAVSGGKQGTGCASRAQAGSARRC